MCAATTTQCYSSPVGNSDMEAVVWLVRVVMVVFRDCYLPSRCLTTALRIMAPEKRARWSQSVGLDFHDLLHLAILVHATRNMVIPSPLINFPHPVYVLDASRDCAEKKVS